MGRLAGSSFGLVGAIFRISMMCLVAPGAVIVLGVLLHVINLDAIVQFIFFSLIMFVLFGSLWLWRSKEVPWARECTWIAVLALVVIGQPGVGKLLMTGKQLANEAASTAADRLVTPQQVPCTSPFRIGQGKDEHDVYWHRPGVNECFDRGGHHPITNQELVAVGPADVWAILEAQKVAAAAVAPPPVPVTTLAPAPPAAAGVVVAQNNPDTAPALDSLDSDSNEPPPSPTRINDRPANAMHRVNSRRRCADEGTVVSVEMPPSTTVGREGQNIQGWLYGTLADADGELIAESGSPAQVTVATRNRNSNRIDLELTAVMNPQRQVLRAQGQTAPVALKGNMLPDSVYKFTLSHKLCVTN